MNPSSTVTIPTHVMARAVGEEVVILNLESGTYFGLDVVGARVWQLLSENKTFAEVHEALFQEFEVAREALEKDLDALISDLQLQGLIEIAY